ncbi:MAG: DciA family protein [Rhabdochlamydiaceae bacterium]
MKKGHSLPHCHLKDLLIPFLEKVKSLSEARPDLILKEWAEIIDPKWDGMTQASSFEKGIIVVKVKNAPLYSLLVQQEGSKLLKKLQAKFPESGIKKLKFCIG